MHNVLNVNRAYPPPNSQSEAVLNGKLAGSRSSQQLGESYLPQAGDGS